MCVGHMKHMKHMKFEKGFFERTAGENAFQRMGYELLPPSANSFHRLRAAPLPRRGRSWGGGCVPARRLVYNPGCRVATLLVLMGVMGFLGDLRGRNSKSPPNPLGLAERRSLLPPPAGRSPSLEEGGLGGFAGQGLPALPSIGYRGFAVAPITLRAPSRRVIITSGINERAMRAPTGDGGATDGCKYI